MKCNQVKIGIVGGGNVGKTLSVLLMSAGFDVEIVCKDSCKAVKINNSYAFDICGDFGQKSYLVPTVKTMDGFTSKKDILIFATRSFDMLKLIPNCIQYLSPKGSILTIQNVFSIDELLGRSFSKYVVCMVCDFACITDGDKIFVKNTNGMTLGILDKFAITRLKFISSIFKKIMDVHITKDVVGFTLGRNIINTAISSLGAISGQKLYDILSTKNGRTMFCRMIEESVNVCRENKIKICPYNQELDYYTFVEKTIKGYFYRRKILKYLRLKNGHIKSSALLDFEHGKKTEIVPLLKRVINLSKDLGVCVRTLKYVYEILADIEKGKKRINPKWLSGKI